MIPTKKDLTAKSVRSIFLYDHSTGKLFYKVRRNGRVPAGSEVGCLCPDGYLRTTIKKECYLVHRLIWLFFYGKWPKEEIDHVNRNRKDNRIINLREATRFQNVCNVPLRKDNKSGLRGVHYYKNRKMWCAQIGGKTRKTIGYFNSKEEAYKAYSQEVIKRRGEFAYV